MVLLFWLLILLVAIYMAVTFVDFLIMNGDED